MLKMSWVIWLKGLIVTGAVLVLTWSGLQAISVAASRYGMMGSGSMRMMWGHMNTMHGRYDSSEESVPKDVDAKAPRHEVAVSLKEWNLSPNELAGKDDEVLVLTIENDGAIVHGFSIPDLGVNVSAIAPGAARTVEIPLAAGIYEVYCPVPGHKQAGQVGRLVVEE